MKNWAIPFFITLAGLAAIAASKQSRAEDLPPQLAKTYWALQQHQPVYRVRLDGKPTPAEADLQALASACLAGVGTAEDNATEREKCIARKQQIVGTVVLFLLGGLLIGLIAMIQRLRRVGRREVVMGGRHASATR